MLFGDMLSQAHLDHDAGPPWRDDLRLISAVSRQLARTDVAPGATAAGARPRALPAPRITAVVLTCDEQETIGPCLRAVANDVDEVLIIDSGSTDRTLEIAGRQPVPTRIIHAPWQDDFAGQRNLAFDHVSEGWIVMIDADEVLDASSAGGIRRCLSLLDHVLPHTDLAVCPEIVDSGERGGVHTDLPRGLRADTALRFRGRIHERPYDAEGNAPPTVHAAWRFDHYGYRPEVIEAKRKYERHARILEFCRAEEPENPTWDFYQVRAELRDPLGPDRSRELFDLLTASLALAPPGSSDYAAQRREDTWALLCELALRFAGADEVSAFAALLEGADREAEATKGVAMMIGPGLAGMPMTEWKIRTPAGKEHIFDSEQEAREALPEYDEGSTIWKRRVHRGIANTTMSPRSWTQVV
ncbi:glycosyltransferase [Streptomyces sp. NPDC002537]